MRKPIVTHPIAKYIREMIDTNSDLGFVNSVAIGDLTLLPAPQDFKSWLPAVLVCPADVSNSRPANKKVSSGIYTFTIRYVEYYDVSNFFDAQEQAIIHADAIANVLMNDDDMIDLNSTPLSNIGDYRYTIRDENNVNLGIIVQTDVPQINYNTIESEMFKELEIPAIVVEITYEVTYMSLRG
jgi:hypothetical protein